MTRHSITKSIKRAVVKIGSAVIFDERRGLSRERIANIVRDVAQLERSGKEIVLVTSGAIRTGLRVLRGLQADRSLEVPCKTAAAVGQSQLLRAYAEEFERVGFQTAQILLMRSDVSHRQRGTDLRRVICQLLSLHVIPLVNENDVILKEDTRERVRENDKLASLIGAKIGAEAVILLSDVEGFYTADPSHEGSKRYTLIREITENMERQAREASSGKGKGGIWPKLQAAKAAINTNMICIVADGRIKEVLKRIMAGDDIGTIFVPSEAEGWKAAVASGGVLEAQIVVDQGAKKAILERGKSLLAAGITEVMGYFSAGATVSIVSEDGQEIARGWTNYSSSQIYNLKRKHSKLLRDIYGNSAPEEIVHRNKMTLARTWTPNVLVE
ncbi:Glutamate 5-kinase [subsurface metagenome]